MQQAAGLRASDLRKMVDMLQVRPPPSVLQEPHVGEEAGKLGPDAPLKGAGWHREEEEDHLAPS